MDRKILLIYYGQNSSGSFGNSESQHGPRGTDVYLVDESSQDPCRADNIKRKT